MVFSRLFKMTSHDMAIDLGTANTVVYVRGRGIVLNEPSVVAVETINGQKRVKAVGEDAKLMMGKTPGSIEAIRPLRDGVIADIDVAEQMIKYFIEKVHGRRRFMRWPEIVICVPSGSTKVERRAIRDAAQNAGASAVYLIEEPMAAAIGADMPVTEPVGSMVVDIGGGTTDMAIYIDGDVWHTMVLGVGGNHVTSDIAHGLRLSMAQAEEIKKQYGHAVQTEIDEKDIFSARIFGDETSTEISRRELSMIIEVPAVQKPVSARSATHDTSSMKSPVSKMVRQMRATKLPKALM